MNPNSAKKTKQLNLKDMVCSLYKMSHKDIFMLRRKRKNTDHEANKNSKRQKVNGYGAVLKGYELSCVLRLQKLEIGDMTGKVLPYARKKHSKVKINDAVGKRSETNGEDTIPQRNGNSGLRKAPKEPKRQAAVEKVPSKCSECGQLLNSPDLRLFVGDTEDAVNEAVMLTHPKLSLSTENESPHDGIDQDTPQQRITHFNLYDKNNHLCPFDIGLIEKNKELFISGYVKPIYDDNLSKDDGIPTKCIGPIREWWTAGFDGGDAVIIGLSSDMCDYILMSPSEEYEPLMSTVKEKTYISKVVIDFLLENPDSSYDDLVNRIESMIPPCEFKILTEDTLVKNAQFIVEQVQDFDAAGDYYDIPLLVGSCMTYFISLTGVALGRRKISRGMLMTYRPEKRGKLTKATTTKLVRNVFSEFFEGQIGEKAERFSSRERCGVCETCQQLDCGQSASCENMAEVGEQGREELECENRRCPDLDMLERGERDLDGDPVEQVRIGDFVKLRSSDPSEPFYICKVIAMWEDVQEEMMLHGHWLIRSSGTMLGDLGDPKELFLVDECGDQPLNSVMGKCMVRYKRPFINCEGEKDERGSFFYQMWYDATRARFEEPPKEYFENGVCLSCLRREQRQQLEIPILGEVLYTRKEENSKRISYDSVSFNGVDYHVGDAVFLSPEAFSFKTELSDENKTVEKNRQKVVDEEIYPEFYRKLDDNFKESSNVPQPFRIGEIRDIYLNQKPGSSIDTDEIELRVRMFYRPENTHKGVEATYNINFNEVYWSSEDAVVGIEMLRGPCTVEYAGDLETSMDDCEGPNRFYFSKAYNSEIGRFEDVPHDAKNVLKGQKEEGRSLVSGNGYSKHVEKKTKEITKLRTLDVFAGCGGLSEGLHKAGVTETLWAIEKDKLAGRTFYVNNAQATVFTDDCNVFLKDVMDESKMKNEGGQILPKRGDVDMLCGGPPCQGFSKLNRYSSGKHYALKNSLVVTFLSLCDYYRPKFFVLENVQNFLLFKKSMVLKLTLRCLLKMGYQCTFSVLQAGSYGVPQTRRRAIILAAAPGQILPEFPQPTHCFVRRACNPTVLIDGKKYCSEIGSVDSAPYRTVTVRDALADLPEIKINPTYDVSEYLLKTTSPFQRQVCGNAGETMLRDHVCKGMSPLALARIQHIPLEPGSDWRDLPNIRVQLSDGRQTEILKYLYEDKKNGPSSTGQPRGVCRCAEGKKCHPACRQSNTLIPWSLPHTGNRHSHWAGAYGRLEWNGFFSTTITIPEPMGKQGRILHPSQDRIVSVREFARSQGFSDAYRFVGQTLDKYRQIGNAVPPPLAKAIGLEIKKCLQKKSENE